MARLATFSLDLQEDLAKQMSLPKDSSKLDDVVTLSNLASPDHTGWLVDMSCSERCWCVLADMLLCVFDSDNEEKPRKVLMMPGMGVKGITYQSAKKDSFPSGEDRLQRPLPGNKTITGMQMHQVRIFNDLTGELHEFGAENQFEASQWLVYLKVASNLEFDIFSDSDEEGGIEELVEKSTAPSITMTKNVYKISKTTSNKTVNGNHIGVNDTPITTQYVPSSKVRTQQLESNSEIPKMRNNQNGVRTGGDDECQDKVIFTVGSNSVNSDTISVSTTSGESQKSQNSNTRTKKKLGRTNSVDSTKIESHNIKHSRSSTDPGSFRLRRSNSANSSFARSSIGAKIARTASNLRDKMFGAKLKTLENASLGSLESIQMAGYLHHKQLLKWIRLWCVISNGMLYAYKSESPSEMPELALLLSDCNLTTVETDKNKRMYIFKLCHLNAKNIYLSALNIYEFDRWFEVFQKEAVFKTGLTSATSTPRKDPSSDIQVDILGNIVKNSPTSQSNQTFSSAASTTTKASNERAIQNRNIFKLKLDHSLDSSRSVSSQGSFADHESELSGDGYTPVHSPRTEPTSPVFVDEQVSPMARFEQEYLNSGTENKKDTYWTEAYIKNYAFRSMPSRNFALNRSLGDTDSDCLESGDEHETKLNEHLAQSNNSNDGSSYMPKFGNSPKHDQNLKMIWNNDRNYQLHTLKSKVAALPNRPDIFNRHLPGPNNEGLLLVGDDDISIIKKRYKRPVKADCVSIPKVASDSRLSSRGGMDSLWQPHSPCRVSEQTPHHSVHLTLAARDIERPSLTGYLEKYADESKWLSQWCVLKSSVLYCYGAPIDDTTEDVLELIACNVTVLKPIYDKNYAFQLKFEGGDTHIFSTESKEDLHVWVPTIHRAISMANNNPVAAQPITDHVAVKLTAVQPISAHLASNTKLATPLDSDATVTTSNDTDSESLETVTQTDVTDNSNEQGNCVSEQDQKQKLLEELQRQRDELQKNQAQSKVKKRPAPTPPTKQSSADPEKRSYESQAEAAEQSIKDLTHLRQRRLSTQLKVDTIQRELFEYHPQKQEKSKKKFLLSLGGKSKSSKPRDVSDSLPEGPPTPGKAHLQNQLRELTGTLETLDRNLGIQHIKQQLHNMTSGTVPIQTLDTPTETRRHMSGSLKRRSNAHNDKKVQGSKLDTGVERRQHSLDSGSTPPSSPEYRSVAERVTKYMMQPFKGRKDVQSLPYDVHEDDTYPGELSSSTSDNKGLITVSSSGQIFKPVEHPNVSKLSKSGRVMLHSRSASVDLPTSEVCEHRRRSQPITPQRSFDIADNKSDKTEKMTDQNRNSIHIYSSNKDNKNTSNSNDSSMKERNLPTGRPDISPTVLAEIAAFEDLIEVNTTHMV